MQVIVGVGDCLTLAQCHIAGFGYSKTSQMRLIAQPSTNKVELMSVLMVIIINCTTDTVAQPRPNSSGSC